MTTSLLTANPLMAEHMSIGKEQERDEQLAEVIRFLKFGELPEDTKRAKKIALQLSLFALVEGILYHIDPKRQNIKRIAVPRHLRTQILEENHRSGMGGHFSGKPLFNALVRHWWWEGMYADAVGYVRNCPECAIVTGWEKSSSTITSNSSESCVPFQIVGVDIMDLPKTSNGF